MQLRAGGGKEQQVTIAAQQKTPVLQGFAAPGDLVPKRQAEGMGFERTAKLLQNRHLRHHATQNPTHLPRLLCPLRS
jgi:hypothetical protein